MSDPPHDQELDELLRTSRNLQSELNTLRARIHALELRTPSEPQAQPTGRPPHGEIPHGVALPPPPPRPRKPVRAPTGAVAEQRGLTGHDTATRDVEQVIGQTWLNRVGAVVLLLAAVFFIIFAFDQGWLSPTARVVTCGVVGLAMIGAGEFCLARHMRAFAGGILGCGVAICYLAAFGAYNFYHLVEPNAAFLLYAAVTVLSIAVSVHGRLLPVAVLAVIGGYGTPIALSTGSNQQIALLTYVLILDVGILATSAIRRWSVLRVLAWLGTLMLFGGWYAEHFAETVMWRTAGFCLAFYLLFHAEMLLSACRRSADKPREIGTMLHFNNAVFFVAVYGIAHNVASEWMGLFAVVCGGLQWLTAWRISPAGDSARPARCAAWQDGAAMLALAAPLQFDRYMVSVSWAVQAAITFWFCRRIPDVWLRAKGVGVLVAASMHLLVFDHADFALTRVVWSVGQWTFSWITVCFVFVGACAYISAAALASRSAADARDRVLAASLLVVGTALMLGIFVTEWERYIATWWWIGLTVLWWSVGTRAEVGRFVAIVLAAAVCAKFLVWDTVAAAADGAWQHIDGFALNRASATGLIVAALAAMLQPVAARCAAMSADAFASPREAKAVAALAATLVVTGTVTFELARIFRFEEIRESFEAPRLAMHVAISIAWSLNATALLLIGFIRDRKELRYAALILFVLTLAKVCVFDISNLEMVYRIVSFAVLGVLLLCASLLYQRRETTRTKEADGGI